MQRVITNRLAGLGLAAILTLTAAGGAVAVFTAGGPGENLTGTGSANSLIELTQVHNSVLWTSLAGNVSLVRTVGWPTTDGTHDLGGGLTLERPSNPTAGTINIGEKPMSVEFDFAG
jgi:hypothetical protein